jgi:CheY-like chemotaxis protein
LRGIAVATVLVVEDESLISMLIEEALQDAGHIVLTAPNASAAILAMEADTSITLVFTDVDMPGTMDGLKLAAYVRNRWPPVHIIIASGKRRPADSEMPFGSLFFSKPYSTREVAAAVQGFDAS